MEIKLTSKFDIVNLLPENPVTCEVGAAAADFSAHIVEHWKSSKHYMVDHWAPLRGVTGDGSFPTEWHEMNYHIAKWRMYKFQHIAVFLRGISWEMAKEVPDESLDFLYVDANHSEVGVTNDLEAWYPKVKVGGIISGHDYLNPDYEVQQAARKFCHKVGTDIFTIPETRMVDANFIFRKPKKK